MVLKRQCSGDLTSLLACSAICGNRVLPWRASQLRARVVDIKDSPPIYHHQHHRQHNASNASIAFSKRNQVTFLNIADNSISLWSELEWIYKKQHVIKTESHNSGWWWCMCTCKESPNQMQISYLVFLSKSQESWERLQNVTQRPYFLSHIISLIQE